MADLRPPAPLKQCSPSVTGGCCAVLCADRRDGRCLHSDSMAPVAGTLPQPRTGLPDPPEQRIKEEGEEPLLAGKCATQPCLFSEDVKNHFGK